MGCSGGTHRPSRISASGNGEKNGDWVDSAEQVLGGQSTGFVQDRGTIRLKSSLSNMSPCLWFIWHHVINLALNNAKAFLALRSLSLVRTLTLSVPGGDSHPLFTVSVTFKVPHMGTNNSCTIALLLVELPGRPCPAPWNRFVNSSPHTSLIQPLWVSFKKKKTYQTNALF